jgi:transcriptional regulator with XRE-family HTH domain
LVFNFFDYFFFYLPQSGDTLRSSYTLRRASFLVYLDKPLLSGKVGVHVTNLSKYERGLTMPSLEVAEKMANALEVSLDKLVYGSEAEKAQKTITDTELLTMFAKAQLLEDDDRKCVKSLLKAFLFQKDMIKQLG